MSRAPEPWLRGPLEDIHPAAMPVFFSFAQVREDLGHHLKGLTTEQIWQSFANASIGFHLRHMAGSVDRLTTYLKGEQLSPGQLRALGEEHTPGASLDTLLAGINQSLSETEAYLKIFDPKTLYDARAVGRQALPTTVIGLLVHLAEHTQRHLGQAITLSGVVRQSS
jgi:uncharacterized damage-inducible protein DinB